MFGSINDLGVDRVVFPFDSGQQLHQVDAVLDEVEVGRGFKNDKIWLQVVYDVELHSILEDRLTVR